jgi:hypothetical protein
MLKIVTDTPMGICLLIYLSRFVNIHSFHYGVLPQTPLAVLYNIRYAHGITFVKSEKFLIPKHIWPLS